MSEMATTQNTQAVKPLTVTMYKHRDVVLKLKNEDVALDLLVSSHALSLSSPVFSAMVGVPLLQAAEIMSREPG
jgi:hypothetical protein